MYDQKTILKKIRTKWAGNTVHFAKETDSTNEWIKRLSQNGAPHGTLAVTEFQLAGKGRLGSCLLYTSRWPSILSEECMRMQRQRLSVIRIFLEKEISFWKCRIMEFLNSRQ